MQFPESDCTLSHTPGRSIAGSVESEPSSVSYAQSSITWSERFAPASAKSLSWRWLASLSLRIDT